MNTKQFEQYQSLPPAMLFLSPRTGEWYLTREMLDLAEQYGVPEDPALATVCESCE